MDIWKERNWKPMLLQERQKPFNSALYVFELKFDGIRAILFASPKEIRIQSRNGKNMTTLFPELQDIKNMVHKKVIFDGEIVVFENGRDSFSRLQERIHLKSQKKIERSATEYPVAFVAFDILYENKDLTSLPLLERKKHLENYKDTDYFIKTKMIDEKGIAFFNRVKKMNLEGIVAKLKTGVYSINKRTDDFIKIKNIRQEKFLIGGYEEKKNNILSLAIGEYIGEQFHFVGKVSVSHRHPIYQQIKKLPKTKNYFSDFHESIHFVKPNIFCMVEYLERTKNNHLRHPIFKEN